jgi:Na+/H+ antiporter NhaD/arsenite permease-like protein
MELVWHYLPVGIFFISLLLIALEIFEKSIVALLGAGTLVVLRFLSPEAAIQAIDFNTIILLMSMMLLVAIARKSGVFAWLNVRLVALTKGNPLFIYLVFCLLTAILSAFLDNVTTILIVVPITIELFRGLSLDPKPLVLTEIFMSNLGGAMTLIGDPPNIIIGGATGFTFNQFLINLWMPGIGAIAAVLLITIAIHRNHLKSISRHGIKLLLSMMLLRRLQYKFVNMNLTRSFVLKTVIIVLGTLLCFMLQGLLHLHPHIVALMGAALLALLCGKEIHLHEMLHEVEWTTLLFFSGLFVMVAGVEHTGILEEVSQMIVESTDSLPLILLIILWVSGFVSMVFDNIPFVTVMIPVIVGIQAQLGHTPDAQLLWWALSLGVCFGGNGSMIGASANVIGCDIARHEGIPITFMGYLRAALPLTIVALIIASAYLLIRSTLL